MLVLDMDDTLLTDNHKISRKIIAIQRQKEADALAKIETLEQSLVSLK